MALPVSLPTARHALGLVTFRFLLLTRELCGAGLTSSCPPGFAGIASSPPSSGASHTSGTAQMASPKL
eukprot:3925574-Alexandrium_andersonii.AAC.1